MNCDSIILIDEVFNDLKKLDPGIQRKALKKVNFCTSILPKMR